MIGLRTLRARLVAGIIVVITVVVGGTGMLMYVLVRDRMVDQMDRSLDNLAHTLASTINLELGKHLRDARAFDEDYPLRLPDTVEKVDDYFQCWFDDGRTLIRSEKLGESLLPRIAENADDPVFASVELPGEVRARAAGLRFRPGPSRAERAERAGRADQGRPRFRPDGGRPPAFNRDVDAGEIERNGDPRRDGSFERNGDRPPPEFRRRMDRRQPGRPQLIEVVVARETTELDATLKHVRLLLVLAWITASVGCAGILSLFVSLNLRPLRRLGGQIEDLDADRLDHRFELRNAPRELTPVVGQLNQFVDRIREAFSREQAFASDAAHELRTPLAGLRSTLEVTLNRPRQAPEYKESLEDCLEITLQLQTMVETLLDIARISSSGARFTRESTSLAELIDACWKPRAAEAQRRDMPLVQHFDPSIRLDVEPRLLQRVLDNLLENAVSHGDAKHTVDVHTEIDSDGEHVSILVSNALASAPDGIATQAFDAFWRADDARTGTGRHVGLGLSLCKRIAPLLEASIDADYDGRRFTVRLSGLTLA